MEIIEINDSLLASLHARAGESERLRINYDLRTTAQDGSQRMLNALEVGTKVPVHRHLETSETTVCLQGCLDVVFYDVAVGAEGEVESALERSRVRLCPCEGRYGVQIPLGAWHSVEVYEPSTIFEAKDGAYRSR